MWFVDISGTNQTGIAIATAVTQNVVLTSMSMIYCYTNMTDQMQTVVVTSIEDTMRRNSELPSLWRAWLQLVRWSLAGGFGTAVEPGMWREVLLYFLPRFCVLTPRLFFATDTLQEALGSKRRRTMVRTPGMPTAIS